MPTYTNELFIALKEAILEKMTERVAIMLTSHTEEIEEALKQIVLEELRKFWKKSEPPKT